MRHDMRRSALLPPGLSSRPLRERVALIAAGWVCFWYVQASVGIGKYGGRYFLDPGATAGSTFTATEGLAWALPALIVWLALVVTRV